MKIFSNSKKGNALLEPITIIILLFFLGVVGVTGVMVYGDFNTDFQADPQNTAVAKAEAQGHADMFPSLFDGIFVFMFGMFWVFALLSAFLIDSHPVFFIIAIVFLFFIIIVGAILANTFDEYITDDDLLASSNGFPMTKFIFDNIIIFIIAISTSIGVVLYAKSR